MMKYLILFILVIGAPLLSAQNVDSVAIRQVDSLIQVSREETNKGNFDDAISINQEAERIALDEVGKNSATYGSCLHNKGRISLNQGENADAETYFLEALSIREKVLHKEHLDIAHNLKFLGIVSNNLGNYERAINYYISARVIYEKIYGTEHIQYAYCQSNIADIYISLGDYSKAELLKLEAKNVLEKQLGKLDRDYCLLLNSLAGLYYQMAYYEKAEIFFLEAINIQKLLLGEMHLEYAQSLNNLASMYYYIGNYEKAEPLYLDVLNIFEKSDLTSHPFYSYILNNLGNLYRELNNYIKAEQYFLKTLSLAKTTLAEGHPELANYIKNIASLYSDMGKFFESEQLFLEAKTNIENNLGKNNSDYALILINLAHTNLNSGKYMQAENNYLESKEIMLRVLGEKHPDFALVVNELGTLYAKRGDLKKAETYYLEAKSIWESSMGKDHPQYSKCLNEFANVYETEQKYIESEHLLVEANALEVKRLMQSVTYLSQSELDKYSKTFQIRSEKLFSYALNRKEIGINLHFNDISTLCFDNILFYKGFLLTAATRLNALSTTSVEVEELSFQLKSYRRLLGIEYAKPVTEREHIDELEEKANAAEKELTHAVADYGQVMKQVRWTEIQSALKPGEAAIEFVHFGVNFPKGTDSVMYAALVLLPGSEQPRFVPLFEEKQLDSEVYGNSISDIANTLYASRGLVPNVPNTGLSDNIYEILWKPLDEYLAGAQTVYYSPSGLLHRLNLPAIPIQGDSMLGDRYNLIELASTRQLVVPNAFKPAANDALLFGGILYDSDSTAMSQPTALLESNSFAIRGGLSFSNIDTTLRIGTWSALPFTSREMTSLEKTMQSAGIETSTHSGYAATEETFKTIGTGGKASPRVLHLATHGFFFPDPKSRDGQSSTWNTNEPAFRLSDHPMIRSGLILAGANYAWQTGKPLYEGAEDGILTAYEISQMNLSNTELVVLSACETGLGDIQGNEGVYGLQRAFKIAGAKYLIMSLWQVPDRETMEFMSTFYQNWLEQKMTIPEAFRTTQREMRDRFFNPYLWAGFVLVE